MKVQPFHCISQVTFVQPPYAKCSLIVAREGRGLVYRTHSPGTHGRVLIGWSSVPSGPTMKLKRPVVMKMYKEQIENFYRDVVTPSTPDNPLPPK